MNKWIKSRGKFKSW